MKIRTLFYTLIQGIKSIFRNIVFSMASVATISACLFLLGMFYAIVMNFQHIVKTAEEAVSVTVFFHEDVTQDRAMQIRDLVMIQGEGYVAEAKYISADEAWEWFKEKYIGEHAEGFPTNPLEHYQNVEIYLSDVSRQQDLVVWLKSIPEVREVKYSEVTANALSGINLIIAYVSLGIIAILLAVSIFLISNTVTIGISVRREEIEIMKYIGATDFFVRAPFVIEGMLIGAIGAAIPLGLIYLLYNEVVEYVAARFPMLSGIISFLTVDEIFTFLTPVSLAVGVGIGFMGSYKTVRKHLHV